MSAEWMPRGLRAGIFVWLDFSFSSSSFVLSSVDSNYRQCPGRGAVVVLPSLCCTHQHAPLSLYSLCVQPAAAISWGHLQFTNSASFTPSSTRLSLPVFLPVFSTRPSLQAFVDTNNAPYTSLHSRNGFGTGPGLLAPFLACRSLGRGSKGTNRKYRNGGLFTRVD